MHLYVYMIIRVDLVCLCVMYKYLFIALHNLFVLVRYIETPSCILEVFEYDSGFVLLLRQVPLNSLVNALITKVSQGRNATLVILGKL